MLMPKSKKTFKDYMEFRIVLLNNGIKDQSEFAKFMGLGNAAISERFSGKQDWRTRELIFMSKKFKLLLDEIVRLLEIDE